MDGVTLVVGPLTTTHGTTINVSSHMLQALERMRAALIAVATVREVITYGELARAIGGAYSPVGLGPALDALSIDCAHCGEPSLDALVVRGDSKEVGRAFLGDAEAVRAAVYERWARLGSAPRA